VSAIENKAEHEVDVAKVNRTIYTVGHSTRSVDELIDILLAFSVTRLIDIRRIPRSQTNPQFNLDVLPNTLRDKEIAYVHLTELGGHRAKSRCIEENLNAGWERQPFHNYAGYAQSTSFQVGLHELIKMASCETCAIMCAEAVWWRCHRRIVTDYLLAYGFQVVHLFTTTKGEPASLTPFAIIDADGNVSYPASAQAEQ